MHPLSLSSPLVYGISPTFLDALEQPVLLLDRTGSVQFANRSAKTLLQEVPPAPVLSDWFDLQQGDILERLAENLLPDYPLLIDSRVANGVYRAKPYRLTFFSISDRNEAAGRLVCLATPVEPSHLVLDQALLFDALQILHLGCFVIEYPDGSASFSDQVYQNLGRDRSLGDFNLDEILNMIHPADRTPLVEQFAALVRHPGQLDIGFRIIRLDGSIRFIRVISHARAVANSPRVRLAGIMFDTTEQQTAAEIMARRDAILDVVSMSAQVMLRGRSWEESLPELMEKLGQAALVNRVVIFRNQVNASGILLWTKSREWVTEGISPLTNRRGTQAFSPSLAGFDRWIRQFEQGSEIKGTVAEFPANERAVLEEQGIQSLAALPIFAGNTWWGFLELDDCHTNRAWSEAETSALRAAANILGAAIQRQQIEESLLEHRQRLELLIEGTDDMILMQDIEGRYIYSNCPPQYGLTLDQFMNKLPGEVFDPQSAAVIMNQLVKVILNGQPTTYEIETELAGKRRWLLDHMYPVKDSSGKVIAVGTISRNITEQKITEQALRQANSELTRYVLNLQKHNQEMALLNEMGDLLQNCINYKDIYTVIGEFARQLFPEISGALYIQTENRSLLEFAVSWGDFEDEQTGFLPDACWALRRGRIHQVDHATSQLRCVHVELVTRPDQFKPYMCIPVNAGGKTLGLLHLLGTPGVSLETSKTLAITVADRAALAIANLKLKEELHSQSIQDALSGLYNRRYMESALQIELHRAIRHQRPFVVAMFDLDRLKPVNDSLGHEAGDALIRGVGQYIKTHIRSGDIACRYGGDEFCVLLPESSTLDAQRRAEAIRSGIKSLKITHLGQSLETITVSIGVAGYPANGDTVEEIMRCADAALYKAKQEGRDRVNVAPSLDWGNH